MKPGSLFETVGIRGVMAGVFALAIAIALVMCRPEPAATPDTVGAVPEETTTTLLEFLPDTDPPDPTAPPTAPPGSLFSGDPCTALVADDFARTTIGGVATGVLVDFFPLDDDACGFLVSVNAQEFNITVQAVDFSAFARPPEDNEDRLALSDIGQSAYGVAGDSDYAVWVKVANGYFVVTTPDQTSAIRLALIAANRADDVTQ